MASISKDQKGWRVFFTPPGGKRQGIRLGKVSKRTAEKIEGRIGQLVSARRFGRGLSDDLADWLASLDATIVARLVEVGLIDPVEPQAALMLGAFLADYFARRTDVKES